MNKRDVERLASAAWEQVSGISLYASINERDDAFHRILAAMVLEELASKIDSEGVPGLRMAHDDDAVSDWLRTIAEGLKP